MKQVRFGDFIILGLILVAAAFGIKFMVKPKGSIVAVTAANDEYEFSLNKNGIYKVEGTIGYTTIEIKDKKVRIIDSPCPNKTCINQGWGSLLICMPNSVIVRIIEKDGKFDAIAE